MQDQEELLTDDSAEEPSIRVEQVIAPRRKRVRGFWFMIAVVAFLSALLGGVVAFGFGVLYESNREKSFFASDGKIYAGGETDASAVQAVERVLSAVVSIAVATPESTAAGRSGSDLFYGEAFRFFDLPKGMIFLSGGSGFFVSANGVILTNKHVVDEEGAEYYVSLHDGTVYPAKLLGKDFIHDIAVLKIDAANTPYLSFGNSDQINVGQSVLAIGNALGRYQNSVTRGIVSGLGRNILASDALSVETIYSAIQTDASIHPGNSGGPLVDLSGEVIGINTAVTSGGDSIGFAIPINEAVRVVQNIEAYGRVVRPYIGVRYIAVDEKAAQWYDLSVTNGAYLIDGDDPSAKAILPDSPAEKSGLKEHDLIVAVNDVKIDREHDLARMISSYVPGDTITLTILRQGKEERIKVTLSEFPE